MFYVIDTSCEKSWPATTPFKDLPRVKMKTCPAETRRKNMPLMSKDSIELAQRYVQSFKEYFGDNRLDPDCLMAMALHPLFTTKGFQLLCKLRPTGATTVVDDSPSPKKRATDLLVDAIDMTLQSMKTASSYEPLQVDGDDDNGEEEPSSKFGQWETNYCSTKSLSLIQLTTRQRAEKAVRNSKEQDFNPVLERKQQ